MIEVTFENGGQTVLIKMQRGLLVMDRSVFNEARKRGEKYAQATPFDTRKTPVPYAEFHQAPQAVSLASGNDIGCESEAEYEVDHSAVEQWLRAILATRPLSALEVMARLTADVTGPSDIIKGLRRLIEALIEEATTHEIIMDDGVAVEAFLEEHPRWRRGFTRFSAADATWGSLYGLSKPASVAFAAWIRAGGLTGVTK